MLAVLILFVFLKEGPLFWTNAGGWAVGLRELVGAFFYPLLLLELFVLVIFSGAYLRFLATRGATSVSAVVVLPLLWALFLLVIVILGANNLENLIGGRPLHWHPR